MTHAIEMTMRKASEQYASDIAHEKDLRFSEFDPLRVAFITGARASYEETLKHVLAVIGSDTAQARATCDAIRSRFQFEIEKIRR